MPRDRSIRTGLALLAGAWLLGLTVVFFAPGFGRGLSGFERVPLRAGHPDFAALHQLAAALLVALAGYGAGAPLAPRLVPEVGRGWPRVALATALGLGVLSVVLLVFAGLGIYRPAPVIALLVVAAALALPALDCPRRPRLGLSAGGAAVAVLFVLFGLAALAGALAPENEVDPLWYHVGFPHLWLLSGHLTDFPLQYVSAYPFGTELLYGAGLALDGDVVAQLTHLLFGILLIAATADLGRRLFGPRAGVLGALVLAAAPLVMWEGTTADVDLAGAAFAVFAVNVAVATRARPTRRAAVAVGLLLGFALASKLIAAYAAPAVVLLLALGAPERARRARAIDVVVALAVAALPVLPYLIRATVLTGDPVFPSFSQHFATHAGRWSPDAQRGLDALLRRFGDGHGIKDFIKLPWTLTMRTGHFDGTFGILFALLVPLALRRRARRLPLLLAAGAVAYVVCWFFVGQTLQARFLVAGFALLAPLAGAGADRALTAAARLGRPAAGALALGLAAVAFLMLPPFLPWWNRERDDGRYVANAIYGTPLPFLLGGETRTAYLDRTVPIHPADRVLATVAHRGDRVLSIDSFIDNTHTNVEHAPYFAAQLGLIYDPGAGDARQLALLRRWRIRYIIVNRATPDARPGGPIAVLQPRFVARHLRLLHADPRSLLYAIR